MRYSIGVCIFQCQKQAENSLEPEFAQMMEDTATYLSAFQESDKVFRAVVDKLTADNGGTVPGWLLDLAP